MVLFLLMWRRRNNTKTERPAITTASSPPTTPAAIMESPELKDTWKLILDTKTEQREMRMDWQTEVKSVPGVNHLYPLHLLTF